MSREWSERDHEMARQIVQAIAKGGGRLVHALSVAREIGLPFDKKSRETSIHRIYRLMPLAVQISHEVFPDHAILIDSDYLYQLRSEHTATTITRTVARIRKADSAVKRASIEMSIAKTPAQKLLRLVVENRVAGAEMMEEAMSLVMTEFVVEPEHAE